MLSERYGVEGRCLHGPKRRRDTPGAGGGSRTPTVTLSQVELAGPTKGPCTERRKVVVTPGS